MRLVSVVPVLALCGLIATPAEARGVRRLQPTGQWVVEYAAETCRLAREFGEGKQRVTIFFEQFVPGDVFHLMFVGPSMDPTSVTLAKAAIRFGPNEPVDPNNPVSRATVGSTPALLLGGFQRLAPTTEAEQLAASEAAKADRHYDFATIGAAREQAATWLQLSKVLPFDILFETGPMNKPLEALRQCSWDTIKSWGLSIDEQKSLTRRARPLTPGHSWFNSSDYPPKMLNQGYEGNVNFRLIVDEQGMPVTCKIQSSTRPQEFDEVVCRQVMKKARFKPALDANGKAIKSYYRQSVFFRFAQ